MSSVTQFDPELIGESIRQTLAIDAIEPLLVFSEEEPCCSRLGINRQIDRLSRRTLEDAGQPDALGNVRRALRDSIGVTHPEFHVDRSIAVEHRSTVRINRMQYLV